MGEIDATDAILTHSLLQGQDSIAMVQSYFSFIYFLNIYLFIYLAVSGLRCSMQDLRCGVWDLSLRHAGSLVAARSLSCPTACGILVPRPGIEPVSLALEGGFLTTGPPGKSQSYFLNKSC